MGRARIYKYALPIEDEPCITMPVGARVLSVQAQPGQTHPQVWALIDQDQAQIRHRRFRVVGTGHPCEDEISKMEYVGTIQLQEGRLVFHVFVEREGGILGKLIA